MDRSQVTIVITTYNRYEYLNYLLKYYDEAPLVYSILILDSSSDTQEDTALYQLLQRENVQWIKFACDTFITEKISDGLKYVETPFAVLCADDDFLVTKNLEKCADYLISNKSYVSAHGIYVYHHLIMIDNKKFIEWGVLYPNSKSINSKPVLKRIKRFFPNNYSSYPFYAVHRTQILKQVWEMTSRHIEDWGWAEIFPSCASIIMGKHKKLNILYSSREVNDYTAFDDERIRVMYSDKKNNNAIDGLAALIVDYANINKKKAKNIISFLLERYLLMLNNKKQLSDYKNKISYYMFNLVFLVNRVKSLLIKKHISGSDDCIELKNIHRIIASANLSREALNRTRREY